MSAPTTTACVAPGCPRPPAPAVLLCGWHHAKLGQTLTDLRSDLNASTDPYSSGASTGRTSGGPLASERDPINLRLIDAQRQAPPILAAWADWLCRERNLGKPGWPEGDRALLAERKNFDWICAQPEIVRFWVQIRSLWSSLRGHLPVRRCTCGGPVWTDRGGGWCSWCSASWTGRQLLELPRQEAA